MPYYRHHHAALRRYSVNETTIIRGVHIMQVLFSSLKFNRAYKSNKPDTSGNSGGDKGAPPQPPMTVPPEIAGGLPYTEIIRPQKQSIS